MENLASNTYSKKNNRIYVTPAATVLFSARASPYLLVYGSGIIGQEMLKKMKQMGKSIELKVLDGDFLGIMTEKEIEVALRNVKTIIIAADSKKVESKGGWFGGGNKGSPVGSNNVEAININNNEWDQLLNEKSLKKLLNATMKECNNGGNSNIKIIAVGKATRQPKSISSFLGGENTEFDSEVILQCKQRGLGYSIVKVGTIIGDNVPLPSGLRDRDRSTGSGAGSGTALKLSSVELEVAQKEYNSPVLFAGSSSRVELGEVTRLSLAVDAVLRSATHPLMNSTTTVLSSPSPSSLDLLPSDAQVTQKL